MTEGTPQASYHDAIDFCCSCGHSNYIGVGDAFHMEDAYREEWGKRRS